MSERRRLLIAGGGIAGLSAALGAAQAGFSPEVFEQAPAIEEFGAGIQLTPNASRALEQLGMLPELDEIAFNPDNLRIFDARSGRLVKSIPLGKGFAEEYGHPYRVVHRADLIDKLHIAANAHPDIDVRLSTKVEGFSHHVRGITMMAMKNGQMNEHHGMALIGADGVRSAIRRWVIGDGDPQPSGYVAWRALADAEKISKPEMLRDVCIWLSRDTHIVTYPLRDASVINIVGVTRSDWTDEGWNAQASIVDASATFGRFAEPIREAVAASRSWARWSLADRPPVTGWHSGPVLLMGDAAHPTLPFAGQGAAMALEDAAVLKKLISVDSPVEPAFERFESIRAKRTARIQAFSRRNADFYHAGGPFALARNIGLKLMRPYMVMDRQWWIYDWTP